ncbi:hypothetical protein [Lichenicola sp.]|uniref:hypothetical protein n=1 Tax=Lichenicola sp. TaxID=2804529 RepID=UPI003AFFFCFD
MEARDTGCRSRNFQHDRVFSIVLALNLVAGSKKAGPPAFSVVRTRDCLRGREDRRLVLVERTRNMTTVTVTEASESAPTWPALSGQDGSDAGPD